MHPYTAPAAAPVHPTTRDAATEPRRSSPRACEAVTVREVAVLELLDRRGAAAAGAVVTHAEIARASGVGVRQVQRRLRRLRRAGLVVVEGRRGLRRPNRYWRPSVTA